MYWVACMLLFAGCHEDENELLDNNGFPKVTENNLDASALIKEFFSHKGGDYLPHRAPPAERPARPGSPA